MAVTTRSNAEAQLSSHTPRRVAAPRAAGATRIAKPPARPRTSLSASDTSQTARPRNSRASTVPTPAQPVVKPCSTRAATSASIRSSAPSISRRPTARQDHQTNSNAPPDEWCATAPHYKEYHDTEWGIPVTSSAKMFEFLLLETFQAGLAWRTILNKRAAFRTAFHNFDVDRVARMTSAEEEVLRTNAGIVRNAGKIRAAIENARIVVHMRDVEGVALADYFWQFVHYRQINGRIGLGVARKSTTNLSDRVADDMKKRGFRFVGSTVIYAHLQAVGIVNDHHVMCPRHKIISDLALGVKRPESHARN